MKKTELSQQEIELIKKLLRDYALNSENLTDEEKTIYVMLSVKIKCL